MRRAIAALAWLPEEDAGSSAEAQVDFLTRCRRETRRRRLRHARMLRRRRQLGRGREEPWHLRLL